MPDKKQRPFENHYLNVHDRIECNLHAWRHHHAYFPEEIQVNGQRNDWLQCGIKTDSALQNLIQKSEALERQAALLTRQGMLPPSLQRLVDRLKTLTAQLESDTSAKPRREMLDEYQKLTDQIMPTIARINERVAARRPASGNKKESRALFTGHDDTVSVALRAASKRR